MDFRDLAYFETIAELGHLGRAAEKLNRSQPALSKSIQRLEASLGARLFQRDGRRIKLTGVGEFLLARGKQLRLSIAETEREVRDYASGLVGNIRLGCAASMADYLLPQLTEALLSRAPKLTLKLSIGQDDVLKESLRGGRLDAIICPLIANDADFQSYPVLQDEAVVVASVDHPIFLSPYDQHALCQYGWVLPGSTVSARRWIDNAFIERQLPAPSVQIETNSISLLPRLIARTRLLSFLARETLEYGQGMSRLREVPLTETTMNRTVAVLVRAEGYLPPAAVAMIELLREKGSSFLDEV
ncbi:MULTISPECIES: LysR family transcriptional regulator [Pseudomonas]|jgi:DNA-binding transcriptional LysR family regulator|uniref:LysR family transcriptional regulator n=1 Tax=Pseudomonas monteilii TaxID=76759 RepID=A0AAE6RBW5_9PSED|nr:MULTISPECIES: LysR family transcriptional regulator [Pseudomonas]ATP45640.1 LysR family transcriptional regulator [Pseudomonas putida]NBB04702.1 LysR family transcriptional regulator [Pseudomonas monteilii]QHB27734.1 LysR family transcriptional regulator [Pseudomonas monteilii]SMD07755.1 transcriptional regulator, LysR family [Pseudomonas sp. URIL14HWK12:I5]SNB86090.1 DNA-binding transcriptional regulator, LysR family [Pseudomonas sp. URIL14HWK12:I8]